MRQRYFTGDIGGQENEQKSSIFDADGTVCDMKKGVPDSAIEAIRALVDNGHEAWLCTGRSRAFVSWYLEQIPFTGMISACGPPLRRREETF